MYKKFIAVDQYGNKTFVDSIGEYCEKIGYSRNTHRNKMYRDVNGVSIHIGYVIGHYWVEFLRVSPL